MRTFSFKIFVKLDLIPEGPAIQEYLTLLTDKLTVPYVFIGGQFVGGSEVKNTFKLSCNPASRVILPPCRAARLSVLLCVILSRQAAEHS